MSVEFETDVSVVCLKTVGAKQPVSRFGARKLVVSVVA